MTSLQLNDAVAAALHAQAAARGLSVEAYLESVGLSAERTGRRLTIIERICDVLTEDDHSFRIWKELLQTYSVSGVAVHDARLVSVMLAHGVSTVVTLNERDFRRYAAISILTPDR